MEDQLKSLLKATFPDMQEAQLGKVIHELINPEGGIRMTSVDDMEDVDKPMCQSILPGVSGNRLYKAFQSKLQLLNPP